MSHWHGYIALERGPDLAAGHWDLVGETAAGWGPGEALQPAELNHARRSLDGDQLIVEARFTVEGVIDVAAIVEVVASAAGINPSLLTHEDAVTSYSPGRSTAVSVFERGSNQYLTVRWFGGIGSAREESRQEALAYVAAHVEAWE